MSASSAILIDIRLAILTFTICLRDLQTREIAGVFRKWCPAGIGTEWNALVWRS